VFLLAVAKDVSQVLVLDVRYVVGRAYLSAHLGQFSGDSVLLALSAHDHEFIFSFFDFLTFRRVHFRVSLPVRHIWRKELLLLLVWRLHILSRCLFAYRFLL
jgi:hypothetical protein